MYLGPRGTTPNTGECVDRLRGDIAAGLCLRRDAARLDTYEGVEARRRIFAKDNYRLGCGACPTKIAASWFEAHYQGYRPSGSGHTCPRAPLSSRSGLPGWPKLGRE